MAQFETRIRSKRDTTAHWQAVPQFIPLDGEIIIYTDYKYIIDEHGHQMNVPGIKIGDGKSYGIDLPFVGDDICAAILSHAEDANIHTTALEKQFWNNKLSITDSREVVENELILSRD